MREDGDPLTRSIVLSHCPRTDQETWIKGESICSIQSGMSRE